MLLLSTLCLLGVVLVGLLLTTSAISLEQALVALARGFVAVMLIVWAASLLHGLVALVVPAVIVVALVIAGLVMLTALIVRVTGRWPNNNEGDDV